MAAFSGIFAPKKRLNNREQHPFFVTTHATHEYPYNTREAS
jgi:hypothetical protein